VLPGGALSRICIPSSGWNGSLVVWAHGYTAFNQPLDFQNLTLADGTYLPDLVQSLGFAFATTSYRQNGLAVLEGADDIRELVAAFPGVAGRAPRQTYLTGASEGGLITTLLIERSPQLFSGALAACGPIGDFKRQIDYWGDFRVLFDYFFPGVIPGSPVNIPQEVIDNWETVYVPAVSSALAANPNAARQLIRTSKAAIDPADPATLATTTINLLWYNVFATNDGVMKLGGNPYGNTGRWYFGSDNDLRLNLRVRRLRADQAALNALVQYQTSGRLIRPLVTLHTTGDEIVPFWHELLYAGKAQTSGGGSLLPIPAIRYGHCNFTSTELLASFGLLVLQVNGSQPAGFQPPLTVGQARRDNPWLSR
jgi:pimeloyl-ACP methyl ester carboxylesterase